MTVSEIDWSRFTVRGERNEYAVAGTCAFFYFDQPVADIAAGMGSAIERYLALVGVENLSFYATANGGWKEMTRARVSKDLKVLRKFPAGQEDIGVQYVSGDNTVLGPFGLRLWATDLTSPVYATECNHLRFDFPPEWPDKDPEKFVALFADLIRDMSPQTAHAGLAFKRTGATSSEAAGGVHKLLLRYVGFDPCYFHAHYRMRDRIFTAHWLNYLDAGMAERIGGYQAFVSALPNCPVQKVGRGVLIRSAKLPPIADANRRARDAGCMPDVARLLKPLRASISAFGTEDFDADVWLARLDSLPSGPWDNSSAR